MILFFFLSPKLYIYHRRLFAGLGLISVTFHFTFSSKTMDSGNSGSVQSSSGGDEEYDSRRLETTISPFLNPSLSFGSISNHQQPPPPPPLFHHQSHPNTFFDPSAQNLSTFTHSPANANANTLYNLDFVWSRGVRSEPNYTELGNLTGLSSSSSQSLLGTQGHNQGPFPSSSPMQSPSVDGDGGRVTPRSDHQTNVIKNSRKRTRASRRAPTTVLTTDTANFRQMVQEFTGIPAPPFSASPYSRRLDFLGGGSALRSGRLETLGSLYPFRPSAQKVQPSPFASSSSSPPLLNSTMVDAISHNTNNTITTSIAGPSNTLFPSSTSNSYQIRSDLGTLPKQPQTMLNMQNPNLASQTPLKYPPAINAPFFSSKFQGSSAIPSLDELGMSRDEHVNANLSGFPSQGTSGGNNSLSRWRAEAFSGDEGQVQLGFSGGTSGGGGGGYKYKLNCSASTSEFHSE